MIRNLDMTALRSFIAVADTGGVTKAATVLNLTQSAVSMQLKRLEVALGQQLLDRSNRAVSLSAQGEVLLNFGREMLSINDEVFGRMTDSAFEGEVVLGVPHDVVYPHIPTVLQRFAAEFPRVKVQLISSYTNRLIQQYERGECDIILTTELTQPLSAKTLSRLPLVWIGSPGGSMWKRRPLRLAFEHGCLFRKEVQDALHAAGIAWEMAVESDSTRTVEASVIADLAVHACLEGSNSPNVEKIEHGGALPTLSKMNINMYTAARQQPLLVDELARMIELAYS